MQKNLLQRASALLAAAVLTTGTAFAQAPTFEWAKNWGGTGNDRSTNVTTDMAGNSYVVGAFTGVIDFNPATADTFNLDAANGGTFISKFAPNGDFIWAKQAAFSVTALQYANGHLYLAGRFSGTVDATFDATTTNITSAGSSDVYVSKLDTAASLVWVKTIGNANNDYLDAFKVKADGSFYIATEFFGTLDTDPSAATNNLTSAGTTASDYEGQISYFDANGDFAWAKQFVKNLYITDIAYHDDALYAVGNVTDTITLPGGVVLSPVNSAEFAILKLNTTTQAISWAKIFGNLGEATVSIYMNNTNPVLVSTHSGAGVVVDYDPSAATSNVTHTGSEESILVEFDANGNFVGVNTLTAAAANGGNYIEAIATDYQNNVYIVGAFYGTSDFNPGTGTSNATSSGVSNNGFMLKLNSAYALEFVEHTDSGYTRLVDIDIDNTGNIYVAGNFQNSCDLDFTAGTSYATSAGGDDAFVFKLDQPTFVSVSRQAENAVDIRLFPNPAASVINIENAPVGSQLLIVDALGRTAMSQIINAENSQISTAALSNGVYFFQFRTGSEITATQKIIIAK
jgi:uncharacterized protein YuzE